jgi:xanthine dehydrogenase FAD-binding subunit
MYDFEHYEEAYNIMDACKALKDNPKLILIAGGSDVLIKIREGKLAGCSLLSIHGIKELKGVQLDQQGTISIGPLTTFSEINQNPLIRRHLPILAAAVDQVGGPQIRNIGTIGGNICNGVTSADSASTLFVLNAKLEITQLAEDEQTDPYLLRQLLPIDKFYIGAGKVDLKPGQLLTGIKINKEDYQNYYGHYIKYAMRNAMDIATLGCAVSCRLNPMGTIVDDVRLAFGVAGPVPIRCPQAEACVKGKEIGPELLGLFSRQACQEVKPRDSWRASKAFRLQLVEELSQRALKQAIELAKAGGMLDA